MMRQAFDVFCCGTLLLCSFLYVCVCVVSFGIPLMFSFKDCGVFCFELLANIANVWVRAWLSSEMSFLSLDMSWHFPPLPHDPTPFFVFFYVVHCEAFVVGQERNNTLFASSNGALDAELWERAMCLRVINGAATELIGAGLQKMWVVASAL